MLRLTGAQAQVGVGNYAVPTVVEVSLIRLFIQWKNGVKLQMGMQRKRFKNTGYRVVLRRIAPRGNGITEVNDFADGMLLPKQLLADGSADDDSTGCFQGGFRIAVAQRKIEKSKETGIGQEAFFDRCLFVFSAYKKIFTAGNNAQVVLNRPAFALQKRPHHDGSHRGVPFRRIGVFKRRVQPVNPVGIRMKAIEAVFVLQKQRNKSTYGQPQCKSGSVDEGNARVFYDAFISRSETQSVHAMGVCCME